MRWLLDTNVWIDAYAGKDHARRIFDKIKAVEGAWVGFSAVTRLEILGYAGLTSTDDTQLRDLLAQFEEVAVTDAVIEEAIRIRKLHRLKSPDALIAATGILQQAQLVTHNTDDFGKVAGLSVLDSHSL